MAAGAGGAALGRAALAAPLVLLYYGFSIGITFYNKWLMKDQELDSDPALSTSLDIGLSNWSFLYVTVSLYTMTKSSAILFILLFSLLFKLEEMRVTLLLVVLLIAGGLFMFTYKSTQFNTQGFILVLCASFLGGIRWTLTQILMQKAELGLQNPIDIMFHLQPLMFLGLFPLFAVFEGLPLSISEKLFRFHEAGMLLSLVGKLFLGGILAFGLGFSEFLLVSRTSSLTLSIAGIFKLLPLLDVGMTHWNPAGPGDQQTDPLEDFIKRLSGKELCDSAES
ncbi:Solute carrier family 35 member C2 [Pitangus sulphuratus]|nr:Solute carrier family 35 member C2 [Pitangus sulphuratus]